MFFLINTLIFCRLFDYIQQLKDVNNDSIAYIQF